QGTTGATRSSAAAARAAPARIAACSRTAGAGAPRGRSVPYLKLIELATRNVTEVRDDVARLGRSPECTVVFSGERAGVVSSLHLEIRYGVAGWLLKDLASPDGPFPTGRRLPGEGLLKAGDVIGLGETRPRVVVGPVAERVPKRPGSAGRAPDPAP